MRVSLVFATLLCFTMWKSSVHALFVDCCRSYYPHEISIEWIEDYTVQKGGSCRIKAIVFYTTQGNMICADPKSFWARAAMVKVNRKKKMRKNGQNDERVTSDITPATATASTYTTQRFHTETGGTICSDQNGDCAKEDVLKVDEEDRNNKLQENGQSDEAATSDITPATATTSTYTAQRENGQNDEGATSDITPATATTSKLHLTEKPNGPKMFCLRNHNTSHSYHSQQTLLFPIVLFLLYCINSKHM